MRLKDDSVKVTGIRPELVLGLVVAADVYRQYGNELVITSLNDGVHSKTSLHYAGAAADLRTFYFEPEIVPEVIEAIRKRLGKDYDVVLEKDHIHLEYQPKR